MAHPTPDDLALVALGEDVDAEVTAHVAGCRACFAEIDALEQVVAISRSLGPDDHLSAPDPRVWERIAEEVRLREADPTPGAVPLHDPSSSGSGPAAQPSADRPGDELAARRGRTGGRRRWTNVAVAAAAALVVGLGGGYLVRGLVTPSTSADAPTVLNALPGWPGASGTASVEDGPGGQRTLLVSMTTPGTSTADGTFEVWISDTKARDMVPMGAMAGDSGRFPIPQDMDLTTHPVVDVSLEPPGDTDPEHSHVSVVRGRLRV